MKIFILLLTLLNLDSLWANSLEEQDAKTIKDYYETKTVELKNLIPDGFVISRQAKGDLNGDSIDDLAILIHKDIKKNNSKINLKENSKEDLADDLPQFIVILIGEKADHYKFWKLGTNHFINSSPNLMDEDGVGVFEIKKGILTMGTSIARSMGGWSAGGCTQKWRNGKLGFQLIGITIVDMDRKCACGTTTDINYLTGNEIIKTDLNSNGEQMKKEKISKSKSKPKGILWDDFIYEKLCENQ